MKKIIYLFAVLLSFAVLSPVVAAPDIGLGNGGMAGQVAGHAGYDASTSDTALSETVGRIIRIVLSLTGIIFLALTVYAGFLWMTAQGNEEQIGTAKKIITAAAVGLAITLMAYAITVFVVDRLTQATSGVEIGGNGVPAGGILCGSTQLPNTACVPYEMVESATELNSEGICPEGLACIDN